MPFLSRTVLVLGAVLSMIVGFFLFAPLYTFGQEFMQKSQKTVSPQQLREAEQLVDVEQLTEPPRRVCHWVPPLYKRSGWTPMSRKQLSATLQNIQRLNQAFLNDNNTFFYVSSGISLGLYRDGRFVSDGDLDITFGTTRKGVKLPSFKSGFKMSLKDVAVLGAPYVGYGSKHSPSVQEVRTLRDKLCMLQRNSGKVKFPVLDEPWQRRYVEKYVGPMWFVRIPWKPDYYMFKEAWCAGKWKPCIAVVKKIDKDKSGKITEEELNAYVEKDGIDLEQYKLQVSSRDKCRAIAKANWILVNGTRWKEFRHAVPSVKGEDIPFLKFSECDKR